MMNPLQPRLAALRRRLRLVITFRGASLFLSLLLASSILAGWLDWRMPGHLPSLVRALILVTSLSAGGVILHRLLLEPLLSPTDDLSLALRVEDHYPSLIDSLASTVEFLEMPDESEASGSAGLRRAAVQQTLRHLKEVNFNRVVDTRGVRTAGLSLIVCGVVGVALVVFQPLLAWTALERLAVPFGNRDWPRQTQLDIHLDSHTRIARSEPFEIHGQVRGVIPDQAIFIFEGLSPPRQTYNILRDRDSNQGVFTARLDRAEKSFRLQVQANDAVSGWYEVEVLPPPVLVPLDGRPSPQVTLEFPLYTDLPTTDLPEGSGNIEAVAGTRVRFRAAADRRLSAAWIDYRPEHPMAKLALAAGPLGASNSAASLALAIAGHSVWDSMPAYLSQDGQVLTVEFLPYVSGMYALHFVDESGLGSTRLFDLRIYPDPAPVVTLERPSQSHDSLELLSNAETTLQAVVEDPQFAIRAVDMEIHCNKEEPVQRLPLYDHVSLGLALPEVLACLASGASHHPGPVPLSAVPLRLRPQRLEISRRIPLSQIKHLDGSSLKEGDRVTLQVAALDFDNVSVDKKPGQSHEVELRIIGQAALDAELNKRHKQIQEELVRLRKWQQEALQQVIGAEQRWRNTGRLEQRDIDRLIQAEQLQQQIRARIGSEKEGLRSEVERVLQTLRDNRQPRSGTSQRMETVAAELDRLARENLDQIEPRLTEARKEREAVSPDRKPPRLGEKGQLGEARRHQEEVENTLNELLKLLEPWGHINQVKGETKAILQEQRRLSEQTKNLDKTVPRGNQRDKLSPAQQADLDEAAASQGKLEERTGQLLGQMERVAREKDAQAKEKERTAQENIRLAEKQAGKDKELAKKLGDAVQALDEAKAAREEADKATGKPQEQKRQQAQEKRQEAQEKLKEAQERKPHDPSAAKVIAEAADALAEAASDSDISEPLHDAAQIGREGNAKGEMKKAQESISKNQPSQASEAQQKSIQNLEDMVKALEERREKELDRLQKKLKEAEQKIKELAQEQDHLRKKTKEAQQLADAAERERQLQELARRQEELRKKTQDMLKELTRLRAERARQALSGASGSMEQAGRQLNRGEDSEEPQEEALDRLNDARRALEREQQEVEEELARERLAKVADVLKRLKERQEGAIAESDRIHQKALQNKSWVRYLQTGLSDLAKTQEELGQDTRSLAEGQLAGAKVFARLLTKAADSMTQAGQRFHNHLKHAQDHPDQLAADDRASKLQKDALNRLDQLLDALKTERGLGRSQAQQGGDGGGGAGEQRGNSESIPDIAQLKVLRALQQEINDRTDTFAKQHPNRTKLGDDEKRELDSLSQEQKELSELLDEVTKPSASEGGDQSSIQNPGSRVFALALVDDPKPEQPEPPVRLKKKPKSLEDSDKDKKPDPPKKEAKPKEEKEGDEPEPTEPEQDPKEIIGRISKNMENSKDRLAQKDPGDGTQQVQRDVIKDLDALINQSSRQQQQQQQQQQSSQNSRSRQQRNQQASQRGSSQQNRQASASKSSQSKQNQNPAGQNPGAGGAAGKKNASPNADLYKDIWGHLPETLRKEMDAYSRVEFMSKYNDLLQQYYKRISEKGRTKGD
jgi:hypothetical protein